VCDQPSGVVNDKRRVLCAFVGGIDLTKGRLDNSDHDIYPAKDAIKGFLIRTRKSAGSMNYSYDIETMDAEGNTIKRTINHYCNEWYNPEFVGEDFSTQYYPRMPWHDIHSCIIGPSAWDVLREFVGRWRLDPSVPGAIGHGVDTAGVIDGFCKEKLFANDSFYQQCETIASKEDTWSVQICRSIKRDHWGKAGEELPVMVNNEPKKEFEWIIDNPEYEMSIQEAYANAIKMAERYIYIETQYFIGSGRDWTEKRETVANGIPALLTDKIIEMYRKSKDFHVYLIVPLFPEGKPNESSLQGIRDFQWCSIESMIIKLLGEGINWTRYFTIGFLANWDIAGNSAIQGRRLNRVMESRRYMVYVHSKMMIVDDEYLIIGSANLNERSLAGNRDSEICAAFWPDLSKKESAKARIQSFRSALWYEHFGLSNNAQLDASRPESYENCAKYIQALGKQNWLNLKKLTGRPNGHFCAIPLQEDKPPSTSLKKMYLIDAEESAFSGDDWAIWPESYVAPLKSLLE
jgi:phospholipase D1/2